MKSIFTTVLFILTGLNLCFAQVQVNPAIKKGEASPATMQLSSQGLSPQTAFLLMDLKKLEREGKRISANDTSLFQKYSLFEQAGEVYANSFLVVSEDFEPSELTKLGVKINSQSEVILTASVPVTKIEQISNIETIKLVQIGEKAEPTMDFAREDTWTHWVHQGHQLPQAYSGSGVVVGIIDIGFDYTHPNFYDGTGSNNYRVKRVWEQNASSGTPPNGFSYGRELSTQTNILNAQRDRLNQSHGTHVAGIAAGAGVGTVTPFAGIAPQSDLVLVSTTRLTPDIMDGIQYIINYANSVNKPCVINMSLGSHIGPHDGTSLFDQYCDGVVGQGKLLVGSAGNEGSKPLYISKTYTSSNNTLYSFVQFPSSSNGTNGQTVIDIWGEPNQNYQIAVNVYNTNTNEFEDWTPYIQANSNNTYSYTLYDDDFFSDACHVEISASTSPLNNKRNVQVVIDHTAQDDSYRWAMIEIIATTGQTKMWAATGGAVFTNYGKGSPWVSGSTSSTMGEIGGTGKSIISVGAYNTTETQVGNIASFSSKGPTADGRTKPDITAPGNRIAASVSRFDSDYQSGGFNWGDVVSSVTNGTYNWYFAEMQGTSMASPMVTGILALWLQAYPNLTPAQAKQLLKDNAWTDSYTGTIPANGSNTWGWGKIDAHEGLLDLLTKIPPQPTINPTGAVAFCQGQNAQLSAPNGYNAYQWSNSATSQSINVSSAGNYSVRVMNNQGYISPWSAPKNVTVHSRPPIPTISINENVLTSSSVTGNQWYHNGTLIQGATHQSYIAQSGGSYHVVVTNANNCQSQSNQVSWYGTNVSKIDAVGVIAIYPNPTNGELNIQFSDNQSNIRIELYDVSGKRVKQISLHSVNSSSIQTLHIDNVVNGVYTLRILTSENSITYKVVVAK